MSTVPRLVVSSPLLLELLQVVYHGLEKGASGVAQTLHDITARATYETYAGKEMIKFKCYLYVLRVDYRLSITDYLTTKCMKL